MSSESIFEWQCNRCASHADSWNRIAVEQFSEHHIRVAHPLFTGERQQQEDAAKNRGTLAVVRPLRRASRPASLFRSRTFRGVSGGSA